MMKVMGVLSKSARYGVWLCCLLAMPVLAQDEAAEAEGEEAAATTGTSSYVDLKPAFVVNYGGPGKLRYIKTDIALRVQGVATNAYVRKHMPYIRHTLVMLLSKATVEDVTSMEGRELLRQRLLTSVQEVLITEEGEQNVIDLLFNSFVVQG